MALVTLILSSWSVTTNILLYHSHSLVYQELDSIEPMRSEPIRGGDVHNLK